MEQLRKRKAFICDMDGVIYHGRTLLQGAAEFVNWLQQKHKQFLFLTNNSSRSPKQLREKMAGLGLRVAEDHFMTSAIATASFLSGQCPKGRAYVIGDAGLIEALDEVGFSLDDARPDYVVVGETRSYNYEKIERAIRLVLGGAKLIGTNYDLTGPTEHGIAPACRALVAPIELATGRKAYYIGKPNPLIMRASLKRLERAARGYGDYRRPHGHRHRRRDRGGDGYRARPHRHHAPRGPGDVPVQARTRAQPRRGNLPGVAEVVGDDG